MSENPQYLTQKQFKEGLMEYAEKVFLPAFEKILDAKLDKYFGSLNLIGGELKVINKKLDKM